LAENKKTGDNRISYSRYAHGNENSLWIKHYRPSWEPDFLAVGIFQQEIVVSNDLRKRRMSMEKKWLVLLFLGSFLLAGMTTVFAADQQEYYLIGPHIGLEYWQDHKRGLEAAGKELGVKTIFTGAHGNVIEEQVKILDMALATKPAGILIGPLNPDALKPGINRAIKMGIPVITVDTDAATSNRLCYIGTNGYEAGRQAADIIAELLGGKGKVGISNLVGFSTCEERAQGFQDRVKEKYPDMEVVAVVDDQGDYDVATKVNTEMLVGHPDIVGIFGVDAASAVGMGAAVKSVNKVDKIKIVAFDKDAPTLELVRDGVVQATMVQRTFTMSYYGLKMLYDYANARLSLVKGKDWAEAQKLGVSPLPQRVDTGIMVCTKKNITVFE
jgi:ribose transport system substrate-binding protein